MTKYLQILWLGVLLITLANEVPASSFNKNIGQRIIGGETARAGQFPYAAAITIITNDGHYFCGGTLISNQWIITGARCIHDATSLTINLGSNSLSGNDPNKVTLATSEYVIHPNFNADTLENDIALIQLRMPVEFSDYIHPIHLPVIDIPNYSSVIGIGWGQVSDNDAGLVDELEYVELATLSNEECRLTYGNQIVDTMVCVEGNYNQGTCTGDSGGPLIQYLTPQYSVIVGVSSFVSGNGCESTDPSGYTRVQPFTDWIRNVTTVVP